MLIQSTRFGELEAAEEELYRFPQGIPGFPEEKLFLHLPHDPESPFSFLQSASEPNLSFLLVDPFAFLPDYEFALDDEAAADMKITADNPPQVFLIATVREQLTDMTVNQLAPLVLSPQIRAGRQVILDRPDYSLRFRLFPDAGPSGTSKGGK